MKNKQLVARNKRYGITFGIALVCAMLFTVCNNVSDTPEIPKSIENGYGRISVNLAMGETVPQTARTVLPLPVFDKYTYTFIKTGGTAGVEKNPDNAGFFTLEVGSYTVEVQAYIGTAEPYTLAASGISSAFSIGSSNNASVEVLLSPVTASEKGVFNYTITYPAGAAAEITLHKWPGRNNITVNPVNISAGNGKTQTLELESGSYLLTVLVSKNDLYAGISEAVHIYPSLATVYAKDFIEDDLLLPQYTVTFDANGATGGTAPNARTISAGSGITLPSRSGLSKTGFNFDGWNTNASGTGTHYDAGTSYIVTGNITLYAQWNEPAAGMVITAEFSGFGDKTIDLTKSTDNDISRSQSTNLTISVSGDFNYINRCYIDGNIYENYSGSYGWGTIYLNAGNFAVGIHTLSVIVSNYGVPYSKVVTFRVVY
jgi:uncharacterized repeat protein (TIGR02543 family)